MNEAEALPTLLSELAVRRYRFVTPTPATHQRVISRPGREQAADLADVFGWSLPFASELLPGPLFEILCATGLLQSQGQLYRSRVRVSSHGGDLYLHSAYPTEDENAVFFGPDSYRFADFVALELERWGREPQSIVDIGTGSGIGAIAAGKVARDARLIGTDVNAKALTYAVANAAAAGVALDLVEAATLPAGSWDLILANPPYMIDAGRRAYRDGGGQLGAQVSLDMAADALAHLAPGGRLLLYTGSAIVRGQDALREELSRLAEKGGLTMRYREIDPDVFGEELEKPDYREVDRIAAVGAVIEQAT